MQLAGLAGAVDRLGVRVHLFSYINAVNAPDSNHRNVDRRADASGIVCQISRGHEHRRHDVAQRLPVPCRNAYRRNTGFDQSSRNRRRLVDRQAAGHILASRQTKLDGEILPANLANSLDDLQRERQPAFKIATVFVVPAVRNRRHEFAHEIAVCAMQLDEVEAGLLDPSCGANKFVDDKLNVVHVQHSGCRAFFRYGDGTGRDGLAERCLAAHVVQLQSGYRAKTFDRRSEFLKARQVDFIVKLQFGSNPQHVRIDDAILHHDHSDAAFGARTVVLNHLIGDAAILVRVSHAHGRHDHAVLRSQAAVRKRNGFQ